MGRMFEWEAGGLNHGVTLVVGWFVSFFFEERNDQIFGTFQHLEVCESIDTPIWFGHMKPL